MPDNELPTIKDRLQAAFDTVMVEANIAKPLQTLVSSVFTNFMVNTDEAKLEGMLLTMRDELIPFILEGDPMTLASEEEIVVEEVPAD